MTNDPLVAKWHAQMQKKYSLQHYTRREKIKGWFLLALFWVGLIVAVPVLLVLLVFGFTADFTIAPTTVITLLLFCILFDMRRK